VQAKGSSATTSCSASIQPIVLNSIVANPGASCVPNSNVPGSLDSCFGTNGQVVTDINSGQAAAYATALQPDGKLIVAASGPSYQGASSSARDTYVLRYDTQGALDPTFGSGGVANIAFTDTCDPIDVSAVVLQPDGRIVVAGSDFWVSRLNSDGTLDTSFAGIGKTRIAFQKSSGAGANAIALQSNGSIVVVGRTTNNAFAFARLTPNGALDPTFNGIGTAQIQTAKSNDTYVGGGYAVAIQKVNVNGITVEKIVAAGIRPSLNGVARDFATMRLNLDGTLDSTFGSGGMVFTDFAGLGDQAYAVTVDTDGSIVVGGHAVLGSSNDQMKFALVRYTANGQLSSGFGTGGKVTAGLPGYANSIRKQISIQPDEKIVIGGYVQPTGLTTGAFAVGRFNPDGSPDVSFGVGGTGIVTTIFSGKLDFGTAGVLLQSDGKIIAAGNAGTKVGIARYLP
jgi:uncharacterized delta-60 repeat protein